MQPRQLQLILAGILVVIGCRFTHAQVDPTPRKLIQLGYNQPVEGISPAPGYAFFYWNKPEFVRSNLTLRMVIAPVYMDTELGIREVFGPNTDLGIGFDGGGYADSYSEVRKGVYMREESFTGHGGGASMSLYHRFNPNQQLPLFGIIRCKMHQSFFENDSRNPPAFDIPENLRVFSVRNGFRLGGTEPVLIPDLGLEFSAWHETQFRNEMVPYGFNGDRNINRQSHLLWGRIGFNYSFTNGQNISFAITGGTSLDCDRFSAFRLGSWLPFNSEFPLNLPGYFYQELSARNFLIANLQFIQPLCRSGRWNLILAGATGAMDYAPGLEQHGKWHSGLGGGLVYRPPSKAWQIIAAFGYGFDAIRHGERGAQSVSLLAQFDLDRAHSALINPANQPSQSHGLHDFMRRLF